MSTNESINQLVVAARTMNWMGVCYKLSGKLDLAETAFTKRDFCMRTAHLIRQVESLK